MWPKLLICLLSILLPLQFSSMTLLSYHDCFAIDGDEPSQNQRATYKGDDTRAGSATLNNTEVLGVKGKDAPAPVKDAISAIPITQGNVIQTERWASMAVMIAIALTAFIAMNSCQGFSIDLVIFGAGALIYLAGEAVTTLMYQGIHHKEIDITREWGKQTLGSTQMDALNAQKESYKHIIAVTKIKEMFQLAAAAAFFAAAATSAVLSFKLLTGFYSCLGSAASSIVKLGTFCTSSGESECASSCSKEAAAGAAVASAGTYAACMAKCNAAIAAECSTCEAAMKAFALSLVKNQALLVSVGPSTDKSDPINDINIDAQTLHTTCLQGASTSHADCIIGAGVGAALADMQKELGTSAAKKAVTSAQNKTLGLSRFPVIGTWLEAQAQQRANELTQKMTSAGRKAEEAAKKVDSAATSLGLAHAPVISKETSETCQSASYMNAEEFIGCPGAVEIPGFVYSSPEELKKHSPWFKFLMNDVYAQNQDTEGGKLALLDKTKNADANEERASSIIGFTFFGIIVVAGLITKGFFTWFNRYLGLPYIRVVLFGVVGSAALATAAVSYSIEKTMEENIKRIDDILNGKQLSAGFVSTPSATRIPYSNIIPSIDDDAKPLPLTQKNAFPCLHGDGKGNCLDSSGPAQAELSLLNLDADTLMAAGLAIRAADGVGGKKSTDRGTIKNTGTLASAAKRMHKRATDLRNLLNRKLTEARLPAIDFATHEKLFADLIEKSMKAVSPKNSTQIASLADQIRNLEPPAELSKKEGKTTESAYHDLMTKAALPAGVSGSQLDDLLKANYEYQGETQDQELARLAGEQKFDIPKNDVIEEKSEDLFKMITIRYFKSAYPVFFQEEK
ncbi:MAG: hypothetical protein A2X86_13085 [Bdellovibrionales bacterium GWA2_49_15]|nr:MAG: hypothetical protein A2X86_13085 [Bdellovibrionales bacterium GWA2_49_15]HAZ13457.1 hypothetical protein [Bdellovibrionales bacterium]